MHDLIRDSAPRALGGQWSNAYAGALAQQQAFNNRRQLANNAALTNYSQIFRSQPPTMPEIENCPPPGVDEALARSALEDYYGTTIKAVIWLRDADVARTHFQHNLLSSITATAINWRAMSTAGVEAVTMPSEPTVRATQGYPLPTGMSQINFGSLRGGERAIQAGITLLGACRVWGIHHEDATAHLLPRPMFFEAPNGIPHRVDGPAVVWPHPQATNEYYLQGIRVPKEAIMEPAKLPEIALSHPNAEVRRVLMTHYGHERLLREHGKVVQTDDCGVLWAIDPDLRMVEVENSTPEPDGTRRKYMLRVPPDTRTSRAGVAWTFGLRPTEYQPQRQT